MFKVIAVTGTNGKTTTTFLIHHILEFNGNKCGIIGTLGNFVGKDLSKFAAGSNIKSNIEYLKNNDCKYMIFEAYSRLLELGLYDGNKFEVGAFTNLTQDHLDIHKTMKKYANAKSKLFCMVKYAVVNIDDSYIDIILSKFKEKPFTYSMQNQNADLYATNIKIEQEQSIFTIVYNNKQYDAILPLPGKFNIYNALTAIGCCLMVGIPIEKSIEALKTATPIIGRIEKVPTPNKDFDMYIDFAHTPDGMEQILTTLKEIVKHRLVVVFGCGGNRDRNKRPKMGAIAVKYADFVVITSDNPRKEKPKSIINDILSGVYKNNTKTPYKVIIDRKEAIKYVIENHLPGDTIVLCGKGHEMIQILNNKVIKFDEREIIKEVLENK